MSTDIPADIDIADIGQRIKRLRACKERLNYTFKDIAEKSGVPESTVKKVMTGATKNPRRKTVEQLEKALGIREALAHSAAGSGRILDKAPKFIPGTEAVVLPDIVDDVEAAVDEQMQKIGKAESAGAWKWYTIEDYYKLPDDRRVELIDGVFYDMAAPTSIHQFVIGKMFAQIDTYIVKKKGKCIPFLSPIDVQLDEDDYTMVEPDILIVCDPKKITKRCIYGAPDFVCEVLSPSNIYMERLRKQVKYLNAGVREYWEIDTENQQVIVYNFEDRDSAAEYYDFSAEVPMHIYKGKLKIDFKGIAKQLKSFG